MSFATLLYTFVVCHCGYPCEFRFVDYFSLFAGISQLSTFCLSEKVVCWSYRLYAVAEGCACNLNLLANSLENAI